MGAIEHDEVMSEDTVDTGQSEISKLVPVGESIRYRKRAQSAEREVEILAEELAQVKSQASKMAEELSGIRSEQELMRKLAGSGVVDLEAAVLIAKARMNDQSEVDLDSVIEQLKSEKRYLFAEGGRSAAPKKTSGARDKIQDNRAVLERAATKAAASGGRADLQEYLKLRRSFV
jgi:hypothetical protein